MTIKQVRSPIHASGKQRDTLRSLKLGRIGKTAKHSDSPQLQGMLRVVGHLVEIDGAEKGAQGEGAQTRRPRTRSGGGGG